MADRTKKMLTLSCKDRYGMKKVLILIIAAMSVLNLYAQNAGQPQSPSDTLAKLQHDYNYMSCDYELYKLKIDITDLSQDINIKANGLLIDVYNGRFNQDLYTTHLDNCESYLALFEVLKKRFESVKSLVMVKIAISDFSNEELNVIGMSISSIEKSVAVIDSGLKYYDVILRAYRDKR